MIRKWINILLSVWLINSVSFPQIINVSIADHACSNNILPSVNSWTEFLLLDTTNNGSNSDKEHHVRVHRKFVHARSNAQTALSTATYFYKTFNSASKTVKKYTSTYVIGIAILPAYYSFLFRLCPF